MVLDVRFDPGDSSGNGWDITSRVSDRPLQAARWSTRREQHRRNAPDAETSR